MNNTSKTNWERVDALTEEEIDTSDIAPLTEKFFSKSQWRTPISSLNVHKKPQDTEFAAYDQQCRRLESEYN